MQGLSVSMFRHRIRGRTRSHVDFTGLRHDPGLLLGGRARGRQGILSHFDADSETEFIVARQRGQTRTRGCKSRKTSPELSLQIRILGRGSRRRRRRIGDDRFGGRRFILALFKAGVDLSGRYTRESREIKRVPLEGLVGADRRDDDADGSDGSF